MTHELHLIACLHLDPSACDRVTDTCAAERMPFGYFGISAAAVEPYVARGCTLIVAGVDTLFLAAGAKSLLAELRAMP